MSSGGIIIAEQQPKTSSRKSEDYLEVCSSSSQPRSECSETESARPLQATSPLSSQEDYYCNLPTMVEETSAEPRRPPRACDEAAATYCNLPAAAPAQPAQSAQSAQSAPPPTLPRRQPHMRRTCTSPAASTATMIRQKGHPPPLPTHQSQQVQTDHHCYQKPQDYNVGEEGLKRRLNNGFAADQTTTLYRRRVPQQQQQTRKRRNESDGTTCQLSFGSSNVNTSVSHDENNDGNYRGRENEVVLLYSRFCPGGVEWAKYLNKLFTELSKHKGKLHVRHLPAEDLAGSSSSINSNSGIRLPALIEAEIRQSRLQIVLLSPTLLQFLSRNPSFILGRLINPDRVLAVMLGVKDCQITQEHRAGLLSFPQWIHLEAKDHDLEFVQTVLYFCTQILNRPSCSSNTASRRETGTGRRSVVRRLDSAGSVRTVSVTTAEANNALQGRRKETSVENGIFHVHPKKVTEAHRRLVIIFEAPQSPCSRFSFRLERNHPGLCDVPLEEWRLMNAFNVQVTIPACCFSVTNLASLRVEIDGVDKGTRIVKLESPLSELDQLLKAVLDPMDFMCQTLGISSKEQLDKMLTNTLLEKLPKSGFAHLKLIRDNAKELILTRDNSEFPTLLHFAAFHGLQNLTTVLLECPGVRIAVDIKNSADLTPPELAQLNGHSELAERLFNFQNDAPHPHIYDYIHQSKPTATTNCSSCFKSNMGAAAVPAPSEYQVPPPPRPVEQATQKVGGPYLEMSCSGGTPSSSPKQTRRSSMNILSSTLRLRSREKENKKQDSPQYQEIKSPPPPTLVVNAKDPFGTLRASGRSKASCASSKDDDPTADDVFLPASRSIGGEDPFGTLRANRVLHNNNNTKEARSNVDYRDKGFPEEQDSNKYEAELAITNELLNLLEEFRTKSYTVKEMETMFDHWRRKASIYDVPGQPKSNDFEDLKDKLRRYKNGSNLLKFFKLTGGGRPTILEDDFHIKSTPKTKAFKRPVYGVSTIPVTNNNTRNNYPPPANETIVECELSIINENDMSVVALPPTPQKTPTIVVGLSSQILPLSRLSVSSGGSPPNQTSSEKPGTEQTKPKTSSPVKDKFQRIGKSLAEPLLQYFHDLQVSPESEEPDVLNTPRSVSTNVNESSPRRGGERSVNSRKLFPSSEDDGFQEYQNMPPITITDM